MLIIKETFIAKPGMASKLAKHFKEMINSSRGAMGNMRVMTDYVGKFNTVVMETEIENLGDYEKRVQEYMKMKNETPKNKMPEHAEMYQAGKREIFRLV